MRKICLLLLIALAGLQVNAQKKGSFYVSTGLEGMLPLDDLSKTHKYGGLGLGQFEYVFSDHFSGFANVGIGFYAGKKITSQTTAKTFTLVPVRAGCKFYPAQKFYIGAQAGYQLSNYMDQSNSGFVYSPLLGIVFPKKVEICVKYEFFTVNNADLNSISLRLSKFIFN